MMERLIQVRRSAAIIIVVLVVVIGAVLGVGITAWAGYPSVNSGRGIPLYIDQAGGTAKGGPPNGRGFSPVIEPALSAVVSITSSRIVKTPESPFFNNPFFQQFFGGQGEGPSGPQEHREMGLGSGVIVSPDGYILTNNHVVAKGNDIKVMLPDKRQFPGKVVGTDPKTDIAVVKIDATNLPTIALEDSSKLHVGDYAFAIGDPFGIGETATMGIISATGRNGLSIEDYEDFIQTDAAINPGNSGGALLSERGGLIGINTAILSGGSGGNQGIGFAIPINMAKYVMDQILKNGKVVRGYIGIGIQELTPDLAKAFNAPAEKGALVREVEPDSPGAKAGLQRGDVVTELNGKPISGPNDLRLRVATMAPGSSVALKILRNGQEKTENVKLAEAPTGKGPGNNSKGGAENTPMRGVEVQDITGDIRQQLGVKGDVKGVVVTDVADSSPAASAGLQRGDIIEQVNRHAVNSVSDYQQFVSQAGKQAIVLLINRRGNTVFLVVQPE